MFLLAPSPRTVKVLVVAAVLSVILLAAHVIHGSPLSSELLEGSGAIVDDATSIQADSNAPCQSLPGGDDVLIVMRTGATEIKDKLTVHIDTTFKCYKNVVIYSDFEEDFMGHHVHDVLQSLDPKIKETHDDFALYRHIQEVGREGLDDSELSGPVSYESGPVGKFENKGWLLDKWKFLPMANETAIMHPDFKWYVFIEPDTYLVWSTLLQWLPTLDPLKASYYGSEVMIGEDIFAHGGSSFVLSKPALEKVADLYNTDFLEWNKFVSGHWAGDCVLAKALAEVGVPVTPTFPMIQGGNFHDQMDWDGENAAGKLWCRPAISYHHFSPDEVLGFWNFEQRFIQYALKSASLRVSSLAFWRKQSIPVLHHRDTFKMYVQPAIMESRTNWNNTPEEHVTLPEIEGDEMERCRAICESTQDCKQYAIGPNGLCSTGGKVRIGSAQEGASSGWLIDRIEEWARKKDNCYGQEGWSTR
jgi:hypothetical protein